MWVVLPDYKYSQAAGVIEQLKNRLQVIGKNSKLLKVLKNDKQLGSLTMKVCS